MITSAPDVFPFFCQCCGARVIYENGNHAADHFGRRRCSKHEGRNPCAVEGCRRTRAAPKGGGLRDDQWICSEHWRRYVPPRSRMRRTYHAHFRRAKRRGWTEEGKRAFWRFWDQLVRTVRRRSDAGHLDMAEINRVMGWD